MQSAALQHELFLRVCSRCNTEKPLTEFYQRRDKRTPSGFRPISWCKDCAKAVVKSYNKANPDKLQKRVKRATAKRSEYWKLKREHKAALALTRPLIPAGHKICRDCRVQQPEENFTKCSANRDRYATKCKTCTSRINRQRYEVNPDRFRASGAKWAAANKDAIKQRNHAQRDKQRAYSRARNQRLRLIVIDHYSKGVRACACCGESSVEFLTLDHIHGGGNRERKIVRHLDLWLINNDFPSGYQILCYNCNGAKRTNTDCPHVQLSKALLGRGDNQVLITS